MRRKKKVLSVLLAGVLAMAMSTTAFAANDPKAIFDAVEEKNSQLDSMDMKARADVSAIYQGESIGMAMDMDIKAKGMTTGKMEYLADVAMAVGMTGMEGYETANAKVFYKDNYLYEDIDGTKIKIEMPLDDMMQLSIGMAETSKAADWIKDLTIRGEGDGYVFDYTADIQKMNSLIQNVLTSQGLGALKDYGMDLNIKKISGQYKINQDWYYTDMNMLMDMDLTVFGDTMTFVMKIDATINNPGQPVEFSLPSTSGYKTFGSSTGASSTGRGPASEIY